MNILIIGGGNMGEALARGLLKSKNDTKNTISIAEIDANRRTELSALPVTVIADTSLGFNNADVVILAVKPQVMNELLLSLSGLSSNNPLFVSIAAGITTTTIEELLKNSRVVRAMPNTPALVQNGITAICPGKFATTSDIALTTELLTSVGTVIHVSEDLMDAVTALTGSGPAYIFLFMEAMITVAEELGLDKKTAEKMILELFSGTSKLAIHSQDSPQTLRKKVTSPGGTTEKALEVLAENEFVDIIMQAVRAAEKRSKELREKK